jgi:hypothetical protein
MHLVVLFLEVFLVIHSSFSIVLVLRLTSATVVSFWGCHLLSRLVMPSLMLPLTIQCRSASVITVALANIWMPMRTMPLQIALPLTMRVT